MARKVGCVCYYAVCVVILAFILPSSDSTNSRDPELSTSKVRPLKPGLLKDFHLEYAVAGLHHDFHTEILSLEDAHLLRVKRQAPTGSPPTTPLANSSGNNSSPVNTSIPALVTTQPPTPSPTVPKITTTTTTTQKPATTQRPATAQKPTTTRAPQPPANGAATSTPPIIEDNHNYYKSTIYPGDVDEHFVELDNPSSQGTLNSGHRLAVTVSLPFTFRFYGHNITNVTIATGGFIYMSPFLHQWLTATQYIAPLMANFDTSTSEDSNIFYKHIEEEFIVEWHNVILKDQVAKGNFIFQAKLKRDGTITFVYKRLPVAVKNISSANHPVKIGLSDAFYNDTFLPQYGIKRRTIIEYHRVAFMKEQIEQGTVIILTPLPTCNIISDCGTCAEHTGVKFDCKWCERVSRCSDGLDWYRQDWEKQGCKSSSFDDSAQCYHNTTPKTTIATPAAPSTRHPIPTTHTRSTPITTKPTTATKLPTPRPVTTEHTQATPTVAESAASKDNCMNSNDGSCEKESKSSPVAAILAVVLVLVVLFGSAAVWVFYAYTHPTSPSGMWLMEHRPSQMKAKLASMKFWKKNTPAGTKYAVESEA